MNRSFGGVNRNFLLSFPTRTINTLEPSIDFLVAVLSALEARGRIDLQSQTSIIADAIHDGYVRFRVAGLSIIVGCSCVFGRGLEFKI